MRNADLVLILFVFRSLLRIRIRHCPAFRACYLVHHIDVGRHDSRDHGYVWHSLDGKQELAALRCGRLYRTGRERFSPWIGWSSVEIVGTRYRK